MSCYLRNMKDILEEAGITVTRENRQQIDRAVHQAVGIAYKNCPVTWKKIKEDIKGENEKRAALIEQLRIAMR